MYDFSSVTATTIEWLTCVLGLFSMFVATFPFIYSTQNLFSKYRKSNDKLRIGDFFNLILIPIVACAVFYSVVQLIDVVFSQKRGFMIGTNTGLINQFWSYDFYQKALNFNADDTIRATVIEWLYYASAIAKICYPAIVMVFFFYYTIPVLYKVYVDKDREMDNMNSKGVSFSLQISLMSVFIVAIIVFLSYSQLASLVMFHEGQFVPIKTLGYAMQLAYNELMADGI